MILPTFNQFKTMLIGNISNMTIQKLTSTRQRDQIIDCNLRDTRKYKVFLHWTDKPMNEKAMILIARKRFRKINNVGLHVVGSNGEGLFYKVSGIIRTANVLEWQHYLKYQVEKL